MVIYVIELLYNWVCELIGALISCCDEALDSFNCVGTMDITSWL